MKSQQKIQLKKILNSVINIKPVDSYDVPSRRIEGQFGGETMKELFSEINVYIQYSPTLSDYEILKAIISQCYYTCKNLNIGESIRIRCYLFNDINNGIKLFNKNVFLGQNDEEETFLKEIKEFKIGE